MANRRNFLKNFSMLTASLSALSLQSFTFSKDVFEIIDKLSEFPKNQDDEEFWKWVQQAFTPSNIINLNNGGLNPHPRVVQEAVERYDRFCNELPTYNMWQILDKSREPVRRDLADLLGCNANEIAIHRNTTEALATVIFGMSLQKGDEVVLCKQDYPNIINQLKQREMRDGIVLKWANLTGFLIENDDCIVNEYSKLFTEKTKAVLLTHVINWCGQLLPVKKIAQIAKDKGIRVIVDGAHSFAAMDFSVYDLECDYFATSLHKWLGAPFGTGLLWVKKELIKELYPLMGAPDPQSDSIKKFENSGTRPWSVEVAIAAAVDFHNVIGTKRKSDRLSFLRNYWSKKLETEEGVKILTSFDKKFNTPIGFFKIEGKKNEDIHSFLFNKHNIYTTPIDVEGIYGLRITPNVYTQLSDLDRFVEAVKEFVKK